MRAGLAQTLDADHVLEVEQRAEHQNAGAFVARDLTREQVVELACRLARHRGAARARTVRSDQVRRVGEPTLHPVDVVERCEPERVKGELGGRRLGRAAPGRALRSRVKSDGDCRIGLRGREREVAGALLVVFGELGGVELNPPPLSRCNLCVHRRREQRMGEPHDAVRRDVQDSVCEANVDQPAGALLGRERAPELCERRPLKHRDQPNQRNQLLRQRRNPHAHELLQGVRHGQRGACAAGRVGKRPRELEREHRVAP